MGAEPRDFARLAAWVIPRKRRVHIAIFILTMLMVPGAFTALEPIDVESYDMDSPEIEAQKVIDEEFSSSEEVLGFLVTLRDPEFVEEDRADIPTMAGGIPDYANLPPNSHLYPYPGDFVGITEPVGGILNLTVLREIDSKASAARAHALGQYLTPLVDDVAGWQSDGVLVVSDFFRYFMTDQSILSTEGVTPLGVYFPQPTQWNDCGELQCLLFDDPALTQAHIDLAAHRMANNSQGAFLRWLSSDRAFVADENSNVFGPVSGVMTEEGDFTDSKWGRGRWSASASWLLVQLDKRGMEDNGWTFVWKDAHPEDDIDWPIIGGYIVHGNELIFHPPNYDDEYCRQLTNESGPCAAEWSIMHLEGTIRSTDNHAITILVGAGVNVEITREVQSSMNLIALMGLAIIFLLWLSLRRASDVAIVVVALGGALLWMQGLIGHVSNLGDYLDIRIISRSQFSNLLPILVLALGIDDSLHALHRYKEERKKGASLEEAANVTVSKVGRAIMLTTLTTMAAFASNLFSDIAALRSFGIEAALGVFAAFILTGIWAPLVRLSFDQWLDKRGRLAPGNEDKLHLIPASWLSNTTMGVAGDKTKWVVLGLAALITIPAAIGMAGLEGDFKVEDFLDESSDMAVSVNLINTRFVDEGEPAEVLIEGDVLDPRVFAAIDETRNNINAHVGGLADKITRTPDGQVDVHAVDELVYALSASLLSNSTPFEAVGWNKSSPGHGVGCSDTGAPLSLPDFNNRGCLVFFYGFLSLYGIPAAGSVPYIPPSLVSLYIYPDQELQPLSPHLTVAGKEPTYSRTLLRFGITQPEDFPSMNPFIEKLEDDLSPFINLTAGDFRIRGNIASASSDEDNPVSWVMWTGRPITRFVAADAMQSQMQSSLILGALFVILTLWWGFRSLVQSLLTTLPILTVVIWLYGIIAAVGASLNLVTVAIAAISLGVGIDYCIHVTERYREERFKGVTRKAALSAVGGASGLALVGSAASDISGFMIISLSPMGLFSSFGFFSSVMILLSLIASLILTCAAIAVMPDSRAKQDKEREAFIQAHTVSIAEAVIPDTYDYAKMANMPETYHSPVDNLYEIEDPYNVVAEAQHRSEAPQTPPKNSEGKVDFSNMLDDIL